MKKIVTRIRWTLPLILISFCCWLSPAAAQSYQDVLYLKNGSIIRGTLMEQRPGEYVKIRTQDGSVFVFEMAEVEKLTRERMGEAGAIADSPNTRPARLESWYTYWALGWANPGYPREMERVLARLDDQPDVMHAAIDLDLLGFYFPLGNHKTILGGIVNAVGDRYDVDGSWMQINQYQVSFSGMHFIQDQIGRGLFLRGDLGLAFLVLVGSESSQVERSKNGLGVLFGGGYGLPITRGTRLLFSVNYSLKRIENERYGKFGIGIGGLF